MEEGAEMLGMALSGSSDSTVTCPVCAQAMPAQNINSHLDSCLNEKPSGVMPKKRRLSTYEEGLEAHGKVFGSATASFPVFQKHKTAEHLNEETSSIFGSATASFPVFQKRETPSKSPFFPMTSPRRTDMNDKWMDINAGCSAEVVQREPYNRELAQPSEVLQGPPKGKNMAEKLDGKPLADKMRPCTLQHYMGQEKVLGEDTMLRKLLQANDIPSIILWGPPGCGKVGVHF